MLQTLKYGRDEKKFSIPSKAKFPEFTEPEQYVTRKDFENDLLGLLPQNKANFRKVAVVVSDKTRLCGYPEYLPWLVDLLLKRGAEKKDICFYIAYGTHPKQTEEESFRSYGPLYNDYCFIHHDCDDNTVFDHTGTTAHGTPVKVRKDIRASSLVITMGAISHHYFAGYGGGRKLIFPGLGERTAVFHNHGLFLDRSARSLSKGCQPGQLEGNPIAEDLKEMDSYMPPGISIHGILNSSGKVCRLLASNNYAGFEEACRVHDSYFSHTSAQKFDLVLASSGGYPKDINFIQAHKSVHHAASFVRDGGNLIMISECIDGIGSSYFMKYLEAGSFEKAFKMLEVNYEGNGGTALSMMLKTGRIRIHMHTSLDESTCHVLGVNKVHDAEINAMIDTEKGSIAVIKNAGILVQTNR